MESRRDHSDGYLAGKETNEFLDQGRDVLYRVTYIGGHPHLSIAKTQGKTNVCEDLRTDFQDRDGSQHCLDPNSLDGRDRIILREVAGKS